MASRSMAQPDHGVTIGIDTHGDAHVAAAFTSDLGRPLGHLTIATTPAGYRRLLEWARGLGSDPRFGVEGTGSYGAGLARFLVVAGCTVIEVNRPNRQTRYARGKSDPVDAEAAARAVLSGEAKGLAKVDTDAIGMIRALRVARRSEGAFANLCGVAPLPASSGKISGRHRLNHGGGRHANCALWRVVIVRLATHEPTRNYMARRTQEGISKPEIIRCLKRYVAREIYRELVPRAALTAAA
jgi:transposase